MMKKKGRGSCLPILLTFILGALFATLVICVRMAILSWYRALPVALASVFVLAVFLQTYRVRRTDED